MTLPPWLPESLWSDWLSYRDQLNQEKPPSRRKPFTEVAQKRAILRLGRFRDQGMDPVEVVEYAMNKGWDGFWPLPDSKRKVFKDDAPRNGDRGPVKVGDALGDLRSDISQPVKKAIDPAILEHMSRIMGDFKLGLIDSTQRDRQIAELRGKLT